MSSSRLTAILAAGLLALALVPATLAASPPPKASPTAVPSPSGSPALIGACAEPSFEYTIDPGSSLPLSPMIQFRESGMGLPAEGRFFWGNGEYGVAAIDQVGGGTSFFKQVQPQYTKADGYTFSSQFNDSCGNVFKVDYPIAVPLSLPTDLTLECPGTLDASGFCLVDLGKPVTFTVGGGPDTGWRWDINGDPGGRTYTRTFDVAGEFWIQARAITADGMLVSPILKVAPKAPAKPRITEVAVPDQVKADTGFTAGFTVPIGADSASPSIYLDGKKIADATSTSLSLPAGTHVITFVLTWPDASTVSRQAGVVSVTPPPPPPPEGPNPILVLALVLGGGLLLGLIILLLLLLVRWIRRRRADAILAAHGRWLRATMAGEGWSFAGPSALEETVSQDEREAAIEEASAEAPMEDTAAIDTSVGPVAKEAPGWTLEAWRGDARLRVQRPVKEAKWLWQDLLEALAGQIGGELPDPEPVEDPAEGVVTEDAGGQD